MKRSIRIIVSILLVFCLIFSSTISSYAHSGRTDSSGGHKDNKNKTAWEAIIIIVVDILHISIPTDIVRIQMCFPIALRLKLARRR